MGVGEAIVDGFDAGGAAIRKVSDLDGCGFLGEDGKVVAVRVHGEIDEDIDAVVANGLDDLLIGKFPDDAPAPCTLGELVADVIGSADVTIAVHLEAGTVVVR